MTETYKVSFNSPLPTSAKHFFNTRIESVILKDQEMYHVSYNVVKYKYLSKAATQYFRLDLVNINEFGKKDEPINMCIYQNL